MESTDTALLEEAATIVKELNKALDKFELSQLLLGPYDKEGAVINITAGAGGTDAQDWADMLLRMYVRWGERQRYKTRVVEKSMGEEAGIKSATIEAEGRYAFGYLSGEKGTHRIVRQSPFNAKGLRQTSFYGDEVMPLLPEDSLNVEIPEEDLQIGFSIAGGSGGQNVNKLETAVRITHIPTGVTVRCTGAAFSLHLTCFFFVKSVNLSHFILLDKNIPNLYVTKQRQLFYYKVKQLKQVYTPGPAPPNLLDVYYNSLGHQVNPGYTKIYNLFRKRVQLRYCPTVLSAEFRNLEDIYSLPH
ncbi:putative peptide chain release factor class I [Helianthus annuus]|uniref:Peptide chain release factor 1 n=1 Tax=Helianthus annuus TaxID=4232 RepID=A0A9K3K0J1_HELAN|nr:peptide chain release factor PrfB1, chloroplastic-like [Helianthus annuus]XP_035843138.1 peptide chain release factor PrfB1, chloroplastic-like [Helianthus annuus]XP_035843139.1 peptide chain release factor PrfB1, chloroplastic-like [Helianthus annuus]XP_035843140.1 peptide chain release factor PrfB1, chloroplastic-like [Helianthus annuus]XP_035843141.1 peptide chain release factor PrfB1, chloroplastic-like [Helianthus annuus]XP_035843142.1 peptide chain release factor PrfB1, chloroplastic-